MKLPEGWRVYALVIALNGVALYLWWLDRDVAPHTVKGGISAWLASRLGS
jgi:hypothetical protein